MKFLLKDEDFPLQAFEELRKLGHDVITLNDLKLNDTRFPDELVLEKAKSLKRALVTHNRRDFIRLHRNRSEPHYGIIVCTRFAIDTELAMAIHEAIEEREINDQLIRVVRPNKS